MSQRRTRRQTPNTRSVADAKGSSPGNIPLTRTVVSDVKALEQAFVRALQNNGAPTERAPYFDGNGDVIDWVRRYESIGSANGWSGELLARKTVGHLKGQALMWYEDATERGWIDGMTWADLKEEIIKAFLSPEHDIQLRQEAVRLLEPNEDLLDYFGSKSKACRRLKKTEADSVELIIDGLVDSYRVYKKLKNRKFSLRELRARLVELKSDHELLLASESRR